jgi:asparagine synthase (glutamine-hydrolysing)
MLYHEFRIQELVMCGIIGFNFQSNNEKIFTVAQHRGPDNTSKVTFENFTLGHNRLSIVDHNEASNQPFTSHCGRYTIVFNGEVYNHHEIRMKLRDKYPFRTESDTEAILYSYIENGASSLHEFQGMFAFAIYDQEEKKLFCARDRIGEKPFLYHFENGKFIFASEMNVILEALDQKPDINTEAIWQYLRYLYIPYPNTIFKNIHKLPPAHTLVFQNGTIEITKYWDAQEYVDTRLDLEETDILLNLDTLFDESIRRQMIADVELGSFLSGGIDSSLILYYMQKNSDKRINTYTLGFENAQSYDETGDAKIMSDFYNTNHTEIIINPKTTELLPKMVRHFGEPFASPTAMLIYELTKETKKVATVALAGDGGDEIFGGYPKYRAAAFAETLRYIPKPLFKFASLITDQIPESTTGNHLPRRIKTFVSSLSKPEAQMYDEWSGYISDQDLNKLFKHPTTYHHIVQDLWESQTKGNNIIKSSLVDLKTYLPNDMLYYGDTMSMANSFEVRFPLLDHKLIEFMTSIDPKWRIKEGKSKYLMKKLLEGKIPDKIINKQKLGLNPPMGIWLKNDLRTLMNEYLSKESIEKRGLFDFRFVQHMIHEFDTNKKDRSLTIWALIVLEEWFRQYAD